MELALHAARRAERNPDARPFSGKKGDSCDRAEGDRDPLIAHLGNALLRGFCAVGRKDVHFVRVCLEHVNALAAFMHLDQAGVIRFVSHGIEDRVVHRPGGNGADPRDGKRCHRGAHVCAEHGDSCAEEGSQQEEEKQCRAAETLPSAA